MGEFFAKNGAGVYAATLAAFLIIVAISSTLHAGTHVNVAYLFMLFALCAAPLALLDGLNGRYVLLAIFMAFFFLFFGMLDVVRVVLGVAKESGPNGMTAAQGGILCGGVCTLLTYAAVVGPPRRAAVFGRKSDWPRISILGAGLALWLVGAAAVLYFQIYVIPERTSAAAARGFANMGPLLTFIVMLGNLLAPLGTLVIAYGYARYRTLLWLLLILAVLLAQFGIAFVTDIRGQALMPIAIVIVALTLVSNRVPKLWIVGAVAAIAVAFPILTAYRATIVGERGLSREQAVENLGKVIDEVMAYRDRIGRGADSEGQQTLLDRAWLEDNVERLFDHAGIDVPFQGGTTLEAIPLAFIPRLIWPDKPDVPTGLLFNHEFFHGQWDTYISPSHLGELYWNFGWPGMLVGMSCIGLILGLVARAFNLRDHMSVTRVLVLLATVYYLCWGFEGALSISYISWMRSLAVIGVLHVLFARRSSAARASEQTEEEFALSLAPAVARFPNVMP
jgi:hypothetical protein